MALIKITTSSILSIPSKFVSPAKSTNVFGKITKSIQTASSPSTTPLSFEYFHENVCSPAVILKLVVDHAISPAHLSCSTSSI